MIGFRRRLLAGLLVAGAGCTSHVASPEAVRVHSLRELRDLPAMPSAEEQRERGLPLFPRAALRRGIYSGVVVASLVVGPEGRVGDVHVLSENPPDLGFGTAFVAYLRRMPRWSPGIDPEGRRLATRVVLRQRFSQQMLNGQYDAATLAEREEDERERGSGRTGAR